MVVAARGDRLRWVVLLAALLGAGLGLRLGLWQLDRAAQKESLQATLDARVGLPPLPASALADTPLAALAQHHRRVELQGEWLPAATVFLDNRQMNGRPGFFVLTPLRLADPAGAAPARLVLVQRGWVARNNDERDRLPALPTAPGRVSVVGRVAPPPARLYEFAGEPAGPIRQNLDLDAFGRELGQVVLPLTVLQTEVVGAGPDGLQRDWMRPAVDVHKHLGYAFQWFSLSALITGLYVWFQLIRPRRRPGRTARAAE